MKMTDRKKLIFINLFLLAIGLITLTSSGSNQKVNCSMYLSVIRVKDGWGYNLIYSNKTFIHQENIPAIQGNQAFKKREDAFKTGQLALQKSRKGGLPVISKKDLDSLHVDISGL